MNQIPRRNPEFSRRQLLKYSGLGAAAVAGSSFLTACGGDDGGGGGPQQTGGILIHGATGGGAKDTIDPHAPVTNPDIARVSNLFEPLLFWNSNYELEPALAESVESSPDGTKWTVKLRQGVTFHNGKDVTAEDAWFSIQRVADPKAPLSGGGQLSQILDFESTKVVDATTLELVLKVPYAILDGLLAEYTVGIIPTDFDIANPVGTGAFAFKSFDPGQTSTFTRYADYWGDAAFVDELQIQDFADPSAMVNALQAGQVQTVDNLPYNLIDTIKGAGGGVLVSETGAWIPFTMRVDVAPFSDVRVRQAMRLIVDRQQMIDQTLSGYGSLGNDLYAPFDSAYASDLPQREQDIDQAKSLLQQAGQEGLQVELFTGDDIGSVAPAAANLFVEQAKAAGVDVKVVKKTPFYDDDVPVLPLCPGLLEHAQLHPAGRGRHVPTGPGRHLQRDALGQRGAPQPRQRRGPGARRDQAGRPAPPGAGDRVRRGWPDHLGLPSTGGRLRRQRPGPRTQQVPPAGVLQVQQGLGLT